MRRIGRIFGKSLNRKQQKAYKRSTLRRSQFTPRLEALEQRQLLAANTLAFAVADVADGTRVELNIAGGDSSSLIALRVAAEGGSAANPAMPLITSSSGASISPIYSTHNVAGSTDSLILVELGPGTYSVTLKNEGGTAGSCRIDALLPGDVSGNGIIESSEYIRANAAAVQDSGSWNSFTARYYSSMGYNLNVDQYHPALDIDANGIIDGFDLNNIYPNVGVSAVIAKVTANEKPQFTQPATSAQTTEDSAGIDINLWNYVSDRETADSALTFSAVSSAQGTAVLAADGHTVHFTPNANFNGTANVTFKVTDVGENGAAANTVQFTLGVIVTPVNDIPVAEQTGTIDTNEDTSVDIDLRTRVSDLETPDDQLVFAVKNPTNGTVVLLADGHTARFTPAANFNNLSGAASFQFDATDKGDGAAAAATVTFSVNVDVAIVNDAPVNDVVAAVNVVEDNSVTVNLRERVSDVETADVDLIFNLEDPATHGTPATIITNDTGTLELLDNPGGNDYQVRFTPAANFNGYTFFSFWATDGGEGTADALTKQCLLYFIVSAVNDAPVAVDDAAAVDADETVTIDVLANDTDVDTGNTLSLVSFTKPAGFEGELSIVGGKIVFDPTGSAAIKQLKDGEELEQKFEYTIKDSANPALTDTAEVTIKVTGINDAPQYTVVAPSYIGEDNSIAIDLDNLFSDAETADADCTVAVTGVTNGTYTFDPVTHVVTFTPAENYNGVATVNFSVTDIAYLPGNVPNTVPMTAYIIVTPINDAPTAESTATVAVDENTPIDIDLRGYVKDVETGDDDLTFVLGSAAGGTVELLGDGYTARFTPDENYNGPASFDFDVTDTGDGAAAALTVTFTINIAVAAVNNPPEAESTAVVQTAEDTHVDIDLWDYVRDAETADAALTFALGDANGGTVALLADNHTVRFTPALDYHGPAGFNFSATDTGDGSAPAQTSQFNLSIIITPVNDAPVANDDAAAVDADETVAIDVLANDTDVDAGDTLSIVSFTKPAGFEGELSIVDGKIVFDPTGSDVIKQLVDGAELEQTFEYTMRDAAGLTDTAVVTLTVNGINDPPEYIVLAPVETPEDTSVSFDLDNYYTDPETADADCTVTVTGATNGTYTFDPATRIVTFTPAADYNGPATVTFSVTDKANLPGNTPNTVEMTAYITVTPVNDAPTANNDNTNAAAQEPTVIDVLANDTDPDAGDSLTIIDTLVPESGFVGTLSIVDNKIVFTPGDAAEIAELFDGDDLTQEFTYEIRDAAGQVSTARATVTVKVIGVNDAPQPIVVAPSQTPEDTAVSIDLWNLFSDAERPGGDFTGYAINILGAANGSAVLNADGHTVTFTPAANYHGNEAAVTFSVTDTANNSANKNTVQMTAHIIVTPVNDAPTAVDDPASGRTTVPDDEPTTLHVLSNDADVDGDSLIITSVDATGIDGQVTIALDGKSLVYTPTGSYLGDETFTYTISDGNGGTAAATVRLEVVGNHDPVAENDDYPITEDEELSGNLLANDHDADAADTLTVTGVTLISGNLENFPPTVAADGSFSYDPRDVYQYLAAGEEVQGVFEYTISDGNGGTATAQVTITITGVNDAPTAAHGTVAINADATTGGSLFDLVDDADASDVLTFAPASPASEHGAAITIDPATGAWTYDPSGVSAFIALGEGATLTDTFTYTVDDNNGGTAQNTITVTVTGVNDVPTAAAGTAAVNANATASGSLADLVNDPDSSDTLTYSLVGDAPLGDLNINPLTGAWSYDPTGVAQFIAMSAGQTYDDVFTYSVSDGNGGVSQNTVTITVSGVNDAPTAVDDAIGTISTASVVINLLGNDSDVDTGDTLSIQSIDITSTGGNVTNNGDGTVTYDPSGWAAAQALQPGHSLYDTFTYTVSDGHGGTDTATVTVKVTGATGGNPVVVNAIDDRSVNDYQPLTFTYDLAEVFYDDGPLSYAAVSSNNDLVQVSVTGSTLTITCSSYESAMDRTPAVITVTATEVGGSGASVSDQFTVTVEPVQTVDVRLIVVDTATASDQLSESALPDSITSVSVNDEYIVEIWMTDLLNSSLTSGAISVGLTGAMFDIYFDETVCQVESFNHGGIYNIDGYTSGTIDNSSGLVDNFGGGIFSSGYGINGNYVRLGYIVVKATTDGSVNFSLDYENVSRSSDENVTVPIVDGSIDESQVEMSSASVLQTQITTFDLSIFSTSNVIVGGVCYGKTLEEQKSSSDQTTLTGTIDAILQYDNDGNITGIQFDGAAIAAENWPDDELEPGIGGTSGSAAANVGLKDADDLFNLAIRNLIFDISSAATIATSGSQIDLSTIVYKVTGGTLDLRDSSGSTAYSKPLAGEEFKESDIPGFSSNVGTIIINTDNDRIELSLLINKIIDLSNLTAPGDYLTINASIKGAFNLPASLTGTKIAEVVTSEESKADLAMTLGLAAAETGENGLVAALPDSEKWIDEWDSYWVEMWVAADKLADITSGSLDLAYNGEYFTAVDIEYGPAFTALDAADLSRDGVVSGISVETSLGDFDADGYVLLGRVKFAATADDQVPLSSGGVVVGPYDLGLEFRNVEIEMTGVDDPSIAVGDAPDTDLWAVPYDVDDSDSIDYGDMAFFAKAFKIGNVAESKAAFVWASDYDHNGKIDYGDMTFFGNNFFRSKSGDSNVAYPKGFFQKWVGMKITAAGDDSVDELVTAAVDAWEEVLDSELDINIQIVVKDFGTDQLAAAEIVAVDETTGQPSSAIITIDNDAAGLGWYSQIGGTPGESQYDLYTVILHEVGHALGLTTQYDAYAANIEADGSGGLLYVGDGYVVELDNSGQHIDDAAYAGDLMSATLSPGVSKLPSQIDAAMLLTAYAVAAESGSGITAGAAAITAAGGETIETMQLVEIASTADGTPPVERLDGDVTWTRLFATNADAIDVDSLDTVIGEFNRGEFDDNESSPSAAFDIAGLGASESEFAFEDYTAWAQERTAARKSDGKILADAVFAAWQPSLG